MKLFNNNKAYSQYEYSNESEFENEVVKNCKQFFGANSIYIDAKRKIESKNIGASIPDGFLFDFSDKFNPEFYIVEVELESHSFYNHIFPQITKFFGFYRNLKSQNDLVEKIFKIINEDNELKSNFIKYVGEYELYRFLRITIEKSQNILLILNGEKRELPEIMETYFETWGKIVKLVVIKKFVNNTDVIYTMHPDFENIEFPEVEDEITTGATEYTEEYHLEGVSDTVKAIYKNIKENVLKTNSTMIFNPQKYYISIRKEKNIAFIITKRKRIKLIAMQSDEITRNEISKHSVKTLSPGVQKFWNGPSCEIIIEDIVNIEEISILLNKLIEKMASS